MKASKDMPFRLFRNFLGLADNSDESWRKLGKSEPYYGVLSADRYRSKNLNEAILADFFDSGERHITYILDIVRQYAGPDLTMKDALDFGCGVGRLVLPLSRHYRAVTGIDISEDYIAEARRNCQRQSIRNAVFHESIGCLLSEARRYDLVHSTIVFNHIPWQRGRVIIDGLFSLLNPGGILAIEVLHRHRRGLVRQAGRWARRNFLPVNWIANALQGRPFSEPLMQGNAYPLDQLLPFLTEIGAENIRVHIRPNSNGESFAFIFCKKTQ
jgi:SAM-dependent methyltransferase